MCLVCWLRFACDVGIGFKGSGFDAFCFCGWVCGVSLFTVVLLCWMWVFCYYVGLIWLLLWLVVWWFRWLVVVGGCFVVFDLLVGCVVWLVCWVGLDFGDCVVGWICRGCLVVV